MHKKNIVNNRKQLRRLRIVQFLFSSGAYAVVGNSFFCSFFLLSFIENVCHWFVCISVDSCRMKLCDLPSAKIGTAMFVCELMSFLLRYIEFTMCMLSVQCDKLWWVVVGGVCWWYWMYVTTVAATVTRSLNRQHCNVHKDNFGVLQMYIWLRIDIYIYI